MSSGSWDSFAGYLSALDGKVAVNAAFMVGHCTVRHHVMGEAALDLEATADQIDSMSQLLHECLDAGGLGLSTTRSSGHNDPDGRPVAARVASREELLTLSSVVGEHPGTTLEAAAHGAIAGFEDDEVDLFIAMSLAAGRPLNWNQLIIDSAEEARGSSPALGLRARSPSWCTSRRSDPSSHRSALTEPRLTLQPA